MTTRKRTTADTIRRVADRLYALLDGELTAGQRTEITSAVITLYALEPEHAGSCTAILTINIMGDTTRHPCRYPHGHTGAHEAQDTHGNTERWADGAPGASHIDHAPDQATQGTTVTVCGDPYAGEAHYGDEEQPYMCIRQPGHEMRHMDRDGDAW